MMLGTTNIKFKKNLYIFVVYKPCASPSYCMCPCRRKIWIYLCGNVGI